MARYSNETGDGNIDPASIASNVKNNIKQVGTASKISGGALHWDLTTFVTLL